jgi:hypothetical protein
MKLPEPLAHLLRGLRLAALMSRARLVPVPQTKTEEQAGEGSAEKTHDKPLPTAALAAYTTGGHFRVQNNSTRALRHRRSL